jgi:hypothetical protein
MPKEHRRYGQMPTRRAAIRARTYEVRVLRSYEEEYIDLEIKATCEEEAKSLALAEATANACLYFGTTGEPSYDATDCEPMED